MENPCVIVSYYFKKDTMKKIIYFVACLTMLLISSCTPVTANTSPKVITDSVQQAPEQIKIETLIPTSAPSLTPRPTPVGPIEVPADPEKGFNWPYLFYIPSNVGSNHLLLVSNNTGCRDNDFNAHRNSAQGAMNSRISWANELGVPLLVPILPRFDDDSDFSIAAQYLGEGTLEPYWQNKYPDLSLIDLQIVAMIDDARSRLEALDINVDEKVFIEGYSASGMFTNRFTILHPDRVQAAAFGGHGWTIVPVDQWDGFSLPFPYGVDRLESLTGVPFNLEDYKRVPIFTYMGELDDNGWAMGWYIGEGYDNGAYFSSFKSVFGSTAKEMSDAAEQIYQEMNCSAEFMLYENQDHISAMEHEKEILEFFKEHR